MKVSHPSPGTLPRELTARLLGEVDVLARRMTQRLGDEVPLGSEFRTVPYLRAVMQACRDGLGMLLRLLHDGRGPGTAELERLGEAGARQAELGVPLEVLLSAYRLAARVVWQEVIGEAMRGSELSPVTTVQVTEHVLEYLDAISGAVGRAYLETRELRMRQRDRQRDRILQRLLAGDATLELRRLAALHEVDLSPRYRVLACALEDDRAETTLSALFRRPGALLVPDDPGRWIVLLPPGRGADESTAGIPGHAGLRVGVGPLAESLDEVAPAARRARSALEVGSRLAPGQRVYDHAEFGIFASLASDPDELRAYVRRVIGPLLAPESAKHVVLLETLEVLLSAASLTDAASRLGLHRHTLVYRQQRLRDLLGVDLDNPSERHRLWLALQARRLLRSAAEATGG
ncbi:MAG: PucR family transcriptional regulator [Candidatus Dormibacteria bacterium]